MSTHSLVLKSGRYLRQSAINGREGVSADLDPGWGRVRLMTWADTVFDVPCSRMSATFSRLSTMSLTVSGWRQAIMGIGAAFSPEFSDAQRRSNR